MSEPLHEKSEQLPTPVDRLAAHLEQLLMREYRTGVLGGPDLARVLGYGTLASLHQAVKRKTVPIKLFLIENRRGKFGLVTDVARWMAVQRATVGLPMDCTETDQTVQKLTEGGDPRCHGAQRMT